MKNFYSIILAYLIVNINAIGQEISPYLIGNNFWYPEAPQTITLMGVGNAMDTANFKVIRIGGFGANGYSDAKMVEYVKKIQAIGAEAIIQVSRLKTDQQVIDLITTVNITNNLNVKYWSIGNEPDHPNGGNLSSSTIATYIKRIAKDLKSVDSTIKVIGPDYSSYNSSHNSEYFGGINDITGKDENGHYYFDIFSWHKYNMLDIIGFESDLNNLLPKINTANLTRPESPITWMIGEFNMHWDNTLVSNPDGKVWSFHAGHVFSELYELGMRKGGFTITPWSTYEGDGNRSAGDLGLFDAGTPLKGRSSYYHSMMLGQNMKKYLAANTDNQAEIKVISMKDSSGVAVMILNKSKEKSFSYTVKLDSSYGAEATLQIMVDAGIDKEVTGIIPNFATQMLVFDENGIFKKLYTYTSRDADLRKGPVIENIESECNPSPELDFIGKVAEPADSGIFIIKLSGISDGDSCKQGITIQASVIDTTIARIISINYTSCDSSGSIEIEPLKPGRTTVILKLTDSGEGGCNSGSVKYLGIDLNLHEIYDIPGLVECEDYLEMFGLRTENSSLGTKDMTGSDAGDYLEYVVNVVDSGTYYLTVGVANNFSLKTAIINVKENDSVLATFTVENTGGSQKWQTRVVNFDLTAGVHTIRLEYEAPSANLDYMIFSSDHQGNGMPYTAIVSPINSTQIIETDLVKISATAIDAENEIEKVDFYVDSVLIGTSTISPYNTDWISVFKGEHTIQSFVTDLAGASMASKPINVTVIPADTGFLIPGKIEAEDFSSMYGMLTETCSEGTKDLTNVNANDWAKYRVIVAEPGRYAIVARVSCPATGRSFELRNESNQKLTTVVIPKTGGYQIWESIAGVDTFNLEAGTQYLTVYAVTSAGNFNYFNFEKVDVSPFQSISISPSSATVGIGQPVKLLASGNVSNDSSLILWPEWAVSPGGNINGYGVFQAFDTGMYTVYATLGELKDSVQISVQSEQEYYNVTFKISDIESNLLNGAKVKLNGLSHLTNVEGETIFNAVFPSEDLVYSVSKSGFFPAYGSFSVVNENKLIETSLSPGPVYIKEVDEPESFFYPNPAADNLLTIINSLGKNIQILDINGSVMIKHSIDSNEYLIDVSSLNPGVYIIRITDDNIPYTSKKLIVL
jgi:hypothetical protein